MTANKTALTSSAALVTQVDRAAEANHRIANELGQLADLVRRQIDAAALGPASVPRKSVVDMLRLHHGRLLGISRLHHAISRHPEQDDVDLAKVLAELFCEFETSGVFEQRLHVQWTFAAQCRVDAARASAVTLAFSEIATNAMKYAHPTGLPVEMTVTAAPASNGAIALGISDDGVGLPEDFIESRDAGVGLKLVRSLIESVGGRVTMSSSELGLAFDIELPGSAPSSMERRLKSRAECLQHAVMCEHMAAGAHQDADRTALLATAAHWRTLAGHAAMTVRSGAPCVDRHRSGNHGGQARRKADEGAAEPARTGRAGNIEQNTHNQGCQQDR